jgi:flagellar basal-body rod modification protein FlgD
MPVESTTPAPVTGGFTPTNPLAKKPAASNADIFSSASFLKLLGAQMTSQNPLEPMKDTEFIGQMAQFSNLEQVTSMNQNMKALNATSQLTQGAAMLGKSVSYMPAGSAVPVTGTVDRLVIDPTNHQLALMVGGVQVGVGQVREVRSA